MFKVPDRETLNKFHSFPKDRFSPGGLRNPSEGEFCQCSPSGFQGIHIRVSFGKVCIGYHSLQSLPAHSTCSQIKDVMLYAGRLSGMVVLPVRHELS